MNYKEIVEFDTKLTADVVAWRPETNLNNKTDGFVLACGTYFLDKEKNSTRVYKIQFSTSSRLS